MRLPKEKKCWPKPINSSYLEFNILTMQLDIITADKSLFSGEIEAVTLPGSAGKFQVLKGHAAIVSSLEKGTIVVKNKGGKQEFAVNGGVVEVLNNKITVLA
jgi:F-type H+-transporting ATPase subunit epsilon